MHMAFCAGKAGVSVVEAVAQRRIIVVIVFSGGKVGNNAGAHDDIQRNFLNCFGNNIVFAVCQSLFAVFKQRRSAGTCQSAAQQRGV